MCEGERVLPAVEVDGIRDEEGLDPCGLPHHIVRMG